MNGGNLSVYYQNVRGLRTKTNDFLNGVLSRSIDIIVLTETWLRDDIHSNELFDSRYTAYRADRNCILAKKCDGGGCLIAIKKCFHSCRIDEWEMQGEDMWISVNKNESEKMFVNVKYIYCDATIDQYNAHLKKVEEIVNIIAPSSQFLLLGDYNLSDSVSWVANSDGICEARNITGRKKAQANAVVDTLFIANLNQFNYVKNSLSRTLDLVISNISHSHINVVEEVDPLVCIDVQHPALLISVNMKSQRYLNEQRLPKFNFFRANYDELNKLVEGIDWVNELQNYNVETATKRFYDLLNTLLVHVPRVKASFSSYPC